MIIKNMKRADMTRIQDQIKFLEKKIEGHVFNEDHHKKCNEYSAALKKFISEEKFDERFFDKKLKKLSKYFQMQTDRDQIKALKQVLLTDCYLIETDFLLSDGRVVNPIGFLPEDKVFSFIDATIAIAVNKLPSFSNLKWFDIRVTTEE